MNQHDDPPRLSTSGSPEVRDLLRVARTDAPSAAQLERLAARLAPQLGTAPGPVATAAIGWKLGLILGVVGLSAIVVGGWQLRRRDRPAVPVPTQPATLPAAPPSRVAPSVPAGLEHAVVIESSSPSPPPRAPARRTPPARPAPVEPIVAVPPVEATTPPLPDPPPRESELLVAAHDALRTGDAAKTLELVKRHAELYPTGALTEEREALAIESLVHLGRATAARAHLVRFVARFPRSGYRARLERLIGS